jgi:hypothetical protein
VDVKIRRLLFNFLLEAIVYSLLLVVYFLTVLRYLGQPLNELFHLSPLFYAGATLLLIVAQAVVLESVTSLLLKWLGLDTAEK